MASPFYSVVIPAHNESKRLPLTLIDIDRHLAKQKHPYEIIVALSPSQDNTKEILERLSTIIKQLKPLYLEQNYGRGYALKQGAEKAKGEWIITMDADNSISVAELEKIMPYLGTDSDKKAQFHEVFDIAIGSRYAPGARQDPSEPLKQRFWTSISRLLTRIFLLRGLCDPISGFIVYSKEHLQKTLKISRMNGWATDIELL